MHRFLDLRWSDQARIRANRYVERIAPTQFAHSDLGFGDCITRSELTEKAVFCAQVMNLRVFVSAGMLPAQRTRPSL